MNQLARRNTRFGLAALIFGGLAVLVLLDQIQTRPLRSTQHRLDTLQSHWAPSTLALLELRAQLAELRAYELAQVAHADDPAQVADYDKRMAQALRDAKHALASYEATQPPSQQAPLIAQVKQKLDAYLAVHARIARAVHEGKIAEADDMSIALAQPLRRELFASIVALTEDTYSKSPGSSLAKS